MVGLVSIIALGFFLGMRHATDPDHVIAVTTIVTRQRNIARSAWIGAFWGLGHTLTILLVGTGIILFNLVIPVRLGLSMELSVGFMLIILGTMNIASFFRSVAEIAPADSADILANTHSHGRGNVHHAHVLGSLPHAHVHGSMDKSLANADRLLKKYSFYQFVRPLIIGIVHGLAGSAAVALLVLTTIRDPRWAVAYLLVFGVGTIAGMMLITMSLASTLHWIGKSRRFSRQLALASGLISLGFGLLVAYQTGIASGLFTAHPSWTPR